MKGIRIGIPSRTPTLGHHFLAIDVNLEKNGFSILSSQLDGDPFYEREAVSASFVLVIGNEGNGVSDAVKAVATHRLCLPMRGGAESLNAAVAAGIMMYDLTR